MFDNDIIDLMEVSTNLSLVAKYQIGMALAANGSRIALRLLAEVIQTAQKNSLYRRKAAQVAAELSVLSWSGDLWPTPGSSARHLETAATDAQNAVSWAPQLSAAHSLAACCLFLQGKKDEARREIEALGRCGGRETPAMFHLNMAALALDAGQFDRAMVQYRRAQKNRPELDALQTALDWLYEATDKLSPNYLVGVAFLNDTYFDRTLAVEQYVDCLRYLPATSNCARFVRARLSSLTVRAVPPTSKARTAKNVLTSTIGPSYDGPIP